MRQFPTIIAAVKFGIKFGKGQKINIKIYHQATLHTLNLVLVEVNNAYLASIKSAVEPTSRILTIFPNSYSSARGSEKNECATAASTKHQRAFSSCQHAPLLLSNSFLQCQLFCCCHTEDRRSSLPVGLTEESTSALHHNLLWKRIHTRTN